MNKSDDTISRQAAIKAVEKESQVDGAYGYMDTKSIVDLLMDLPSAQRWMPISDGKPKENGRYYVTRGLNACGALWNRVYIINYSDLMGLKSERIWWDGNVGKSDFEEITDVLAWMQLPKPWKGES